MSVTRAKAVAWAATVAFFTNLGGCSDTTDPASSEVDGGGSALPPGDASPDIDGAQPEGGADVDASPRICSDDGFCHSVLPRGQHLRGVWGDGTGVVWAVSVERDILRWDGTSWIVYAHALGDITSLWGSGPTDVWVATTEALLHGTGASASSLVFTPVLDLPGDATAPIASVWGTGPNDAWAAGGLDSAAPPKARVLHYDGTAWTVDVGMSSQPVAFRGIWGSPTSGVWLHGVQPDETDNPRVVVFRRGTGKAIWEPIALPPDPGSEFYPYASHVVATHIASDTSVWILGYTPMPVDGLWHGTSTNGGTTFDWAFQTPNPDPNDRDLLGVWGTPDKMWAIGKTGLVARWTGKRWQQAILRVTDAPVGRSLYAIWGKSDDDFWVVGDEIALHKTNAGKP